MTIIVVDGPEKAGKTTFIKALADRLSEKHEVHVSKWGPIDPDDRVYSPVLQYQSQNPTQVFIWDRTWASEYVYGNLLKRSRRLSDDPWLGAWLHDRVVQANGMRIMLLGKSSEDLMRMRDSTDLKVDPKKEVKLFEEYATRFGWMQLKGYEYTKKGLNENIVQVMKYFKPSKAKMPHPPHWAGPQDADVVFIGMIKTENQIPGGWLPFSDTMTTKFARLFGDNALKYAWTTAHNVNPKHLRNRKVLVPCGATSGLWVENYVGKENSKTTIIPISHPSYLLRFKNEKVKYALATTIDKLDSVLHFK